MAGEQAQLQRCVIIQLAAPAGSVPAPTQPVIGPPRVDGSVPHYVMSPRTPEDLRTTGVNFFFEAITGETTGPFNVTLWKRDPTNQRWAVWITYAVLPADNWVTVCGLDASELYWQVAPTTVEDAARMLLHVEEIGV